jgi:hypothetical protein
VLGRSTLGIFRKVARLAPAEEVTVFTEGHEIVFEGKGRAWGLKVEPVKMPLDKVEQPASWSPVPAELFNAFDLCAQSAARSDKKGDHWLCLHITPDYVEGSDGEEAYPVGLRAAQAAGQAADRQQHRPPRNPPLVDSRPALLSDSDRAALLASYLPGAGQAQEVVTCTTQHFRGAKG